MICEVRCLCFCQCWVGYKLQKKKKRGGGGCRNTTLHLDLSAGFKKQWFPYLLCQKILTLFDSQFVFIFRVDDSVGYDMKTRVMIYHTSLGMGFLLKKELTRGRKR